MCPMSSPRNRPGQSARDIRDRLHDKRMLVALIGGVAILLCLVLLPHLAGVGIGGLVVLVILMKAVGDITESKTKGYRKLEKRAERGAKAEERVDSILSGFSGESATFHDVDTGRGDIDHIVLSRERGIFLIETKAHHGKVTVSNGKILVNGEPPEKDFIAQTLRNTMWLKERVKTATGIDAWIQPILVFPHAFVQEWRPVKGILLRNGKYLVRAIEETRSNPSVAARLWAVHEEGRMLW